ncbi:glycerate kinase [Paenibacillus roseipurpureus]|uniref:Glycerate kinase n=1 Tax=Paenibacillus roseopurpureus TaxID=2918901 RepID=A0AA96LK91_9BACL|nr:glycerate kinase [Paenibacillus sp. MBLB1832]WNR42642.1 glycerate kinase [Paenibacillus sp. MBLB1832]
MKIVIAPDSFKGSLSSEAAARAIQEGILRALPDAEIVLIPIADGGEGTVDSLVQATQGKKVAVTVQGPLQEPVTASYGVLGNGTTCVIEMAQASGLMLVPAAQRNPLITTTYGTGQLIKHALDQGYRDFILALGGSATNDGGAGMLQALGLQLQDAEGRELAPGGQALAQLAQIDASQWDARIQEAHFLLASDVTNPFIGPHGASAVFGPQKGATPEMVALLDQALAHWADLIEAHTGKAVHDMPGAGAAGGLGGAFQAFFPSRTRRGVDVMIELTKLVEQLDGASLVITGEGQTDGQTASGKTPMGIAQAAKLKGIPCIVLSGSLGKGIEKLYEHGVTSIHSIVNAPMSLQEAMSRTAELLAQKAEQVMLTFLAGKRKEE